MAKYLKVGTNHQTLVDDDDYEKLKHLRFHKYVSSHNGFIYPRESKTKRYIHRFILNDFDPKTTVDHINRDSLDNRKENLRICTTQQNCINRPAQRNNTTGFKGVFKREKPTPGYKDRWRACIRFNQKLIHLGTFNNPEDAAKAYNDKALELFREFAHLNVIKET